MMNINRCSNNKQKHTEFRMKKNKRVRKPNALIYHGTYILTSSYYRRAYGLTTDKTGISGLKPPFLVVSGHSCWLDYMIAFISMYPYRMNYVAAYNFFRKKFGQKTARSTPFLRRKAHGSLRAHRKIYLNFFYQMKCFNF